MLIQLLLILFKLTKEKASRLLDLCRAIYCAAEREQTTRDIRRVKRACVALHAAFTRPIHMFLRGRKAVILMRSFGTKARQNRFYTPRLQLFFVDAFSESVAF